MRILFTGSPGAGKTTYAKWLAKKLKSKYINEKEFALEHRIGGFEGEELVIPLNKLQKKLKEELKGKKNYVLDGHLLCEIKLPVDLVFVVRMHPEMLEGILEKRGYNVDKVQDNVFCEGIDYCLKHAKRNYPGKVVEMRNEESFKAVKGAILKELKKKGLK
jgi:adenylate kinase